MSEKKPTARKPAKKPTTKQPTDEVNKGGRPTKYEEHFPADLIAWFDVEPYRELVDQNGKEYLMPNRFPTLAGWCGKMRISRSTLHEWVANHPKFSDAYKTCKEMQEEALVQGAISGAYATAFSVFTAKNVLGWRDKQPDEVEEQKPIEIRIVDATRKED